MSRSRRSRCSACSRSRSCVPHRVPHAVTPADVAVAADGTRIATQQQPDGGFEVAAFPGFETRDAPLAIAEHAQTGSSWSTSEALAAPAVLEFGMRGPTPLDALDAYAAEIAANAARRRGAAAKTIVLSAGRSGSNRPRSTRPVTATRSTSPPRSTTTATSSCSPTCSGACSPASHSAVTRPPTPRQWCARRSRPTAAGASPATPPRQGLRRRHHRPRRPGADRYATGDDPAVVAALRLAAQQQAPDGGWLDFGTESNPSTAPSSCSVSRPPASTSRRPAGATRSHRSSPAPRTPTRSHGPDRNSSPTATSRARTTPSVEHAHHVAVGARTAARVAPGGDRDASNVCGHATAVRRRRRRRPSPPSHRGSRDDPACGAPSPSSSRWSQSATAGAGLAKVETPVAHATATAVVVVDTGSSVRWWWSTSAAAAPAASRRCAGRGGRDGQLRRRRRGGVPDRRCRQPA